MYRSQKILMTTVLLFTIWLCVYALVTKMLLEMIFLFTLWLCIYVQVTKILMMIVLLFTISFVFMYRSQRCWWPFDITVHTVALCLCTGQNDADDYRITVNTMTLCLCTGHEDADDHSITVHSSSLCPYRRICRNPISSYKALSQLDSCNPIMWHPITVSWVSRMCVAARRLLCVRRGGVRGVVKLCYAVLVWKQNCSTPSLSSAAPPPPAAAGEENSVCVTSTVVWWATG